MTLDWQHLARSWMAKDPDPNRVAQLESLLADPIDHQALALLFDGRIQFGTAGLRAGLGPGPNRMNRLVVRQTTAGVMAWLGRQGSNETPTVVIGFDARHESDVFAMDTARVAAAAGASVLLFPQPVPTPVLAHALLQRGGDVGVMVTASHNPPADNGYKLYLADGIQLVSPADAEIAALIDDIAGQEREIDIAESDDPAIRYLTEEDIAAHRGACLNALLTDHRDVAVVYTAMHGVGGEAFVQAAVAAGFPQPVAVESQFHPDPEFPTVAFPNPEEPGAMDLAVAQAEQVGADAVIANDPDADRLALAVRDRDGRMVKLSGDQVGVLLGDHIFRHEDLAGTQVAMSLVSSRLLAAMAADADVLCHTTLTGFKWVARPIVEVPDRRYLLGYEEALGYCVGSAVRDKDGISAGLLAMEMLAQIKHADETVWDRLDHLAVRHGLHETLGISVPIQAGSGDEIVAQILADPPQFLSDSDAVVPVSDIVDLAAGERFAPTSGVVVHYADKTRLIVRPSGTEPKIKAYLEVVQPVSGVEGLENAKKTATTRLSNVGETVRRRLGGG